MNNDDRELPPAPKAEILSDGRQRDPTVSDYLQIAPIIAVALGGVYICYRLALPFLTPLALALALAILFTPFHSWMSGKVRSPALSTALSVFIIAAIVIVPITLLVVQVVQQAANAAQLIRTEVEGGLFEKTMADHPKIAPGVTWVLDKIDLPGLISGGASWLTNISTSFLRGSVVQFVGMLLTFYLLFFFLRDRRAALASLRTFLPFSDAETSVLFRRVVDTVYATIFGTVVSGTIQGLIGGLIFLALGLPAPLMWGLVMGLLAMLPVVGTGMIWVPAAIFLAFSAAWIKAAILVAAFIGLTMFDTFLNPFIVGNRMKQHTAVTFISAIGGLIMFGPVGFILGPVAVAVTLAMIDILHARLQA